jgi:hypothetical protein
MKVVGGQFEKRKGTSRRGRETREGNGVNMIKDIIYMYEKSQ